jgi:hypothetical protein
VESRKGQESHREGAQSNDRPGADFRLSICDWGAISYNRLAEAVDSASNHLSEARRSRLSLSSAGRFFSLSPRSSLAPLRSRPHSPRSLSQPARNRFGSQNGPLAWHCGHPNRPNLHDCSLPKRPIRLKPPRSHRRRPRCRPPRRHQRTHTSPIRQLPLHLHRPQRPHRHRPLQP